MFEPGAPLDTIYFPQTGLISLLVLTATGDYIETTTVGRKGAVGLEGRFGTRFSFTRASDWRVFHRHPRRPLRGTC